MDIHITFEDNALTPELFLMLRSAVGWTGNEHQIQKSLENGRYNVIAKYGESVVGMGRLVGDGVMYWYVQDLIVVPSQQSKGIGSSILKRLMEHVAHNSLPDTTVTIGLMSVKGKEPFYQKYGFISRPNDSLGAGMVLYYHKAG